MSKAQPDDLEQAKRAKVLASLPPDIATRALSGAEVVELERNDTLYEQGNLADSLFIVLDGWVKICRISANGAESVIAVFSNGESFGTGAAMARTRFAASALAASKARVLKVPVAQLIGELERDPQIAVSALTTVFEFMEELMYNIEQRDAMTATQRLGNFLLDSAAGKSGTVTIRLPHDKGLLAGRLGMTPESLSRAFNQLRQHGATVSGSTIVVDDLDQLKQFIALRTRTAS